MTASQTRSGTILVLLAAALWGTTGTAQALAPAGFDSMAIGFLRLALGGTAILLLSLAQGGLAQFRGWPLAATLWGALLIALYQICFFSALTKTGVAVGTIVGIGSSPVAGGALGYLFLGERPSRCWFVATFLAITGCVILTLSGGGTVRVDPVGIALAIGAGIAYAAYALAIKGLMENHTPNIVIAVTFSLGALMIAPLMIGREMSWLASPRSIAVILHLGLVTAALAYWLFARGLQRVPVATAVTLSLAEPLVAGLLGLLLLGEQLNSLSFVGIALIFSGLAVLTFRRRTATSEAVESLG